jgi:hypothetical protein
VTNGRLRLSDDDFWTDPMRTRAELSRELDERGIILDAPRAVPLATRATCPVAGLWLRDGLVEAGLSFNDAAIVVAAERDGDGLLVGRPLAGDQPMKRPATKASPKALAKMSLASGFAFELRALGLPWRPGRWTVALLAREHASNQVEVALEPAYHDPAVAEFLARRRAEVAPPSPTPGVVLDPTDAPPVPEGVGVALAVERVVVEGEPRVLRGAVRLPAPPAHGVATVHLVSTGSELPEPRVVTLRVPARGATARFAVDLASLPDAPRVPMTHFIYGVAGGHISTATTMAIVPAAALAR